MRPESTPRSPGCAANTTLALWLRPTELTVLEHSSGCPNAET